MNRRRDTNTIEAGGLVLGVGACLLIMITGLFYVYLKNQQHAVGDRLRVVSAQLREAEARNQACSAKITALTSRSALMHRLEEKYIELEAIRETAIARVTPGGPAEMDGELRTASRDPATRIINGAPQRVLSR
jgi:hypothetical protein